MQGHAAHIPMDVPRLEIDPFSEEFLSDPFAYHPRLREVGPVFWLEAIGVYGVARHEEVTQVLKNHEVFVSSRGVGLADFSKEKPFRPPSLLLEADPPLHNKTRAVMNRIVAMPVLKGLEDEWRAKAKDLVAELIQKDEFDAVIDLAEEFPMRVFPDAVGLMDEGRHHLLTYAAIVFNAFGPRNKIFDNINIPEGSKVLTFLAAANRDEGRWENPNDFSVTRNASGHVGFGHGIHVCLGQMVARMEADALLSAMREKISRITAVGGGLEYDGHACTY